MKISIVQKILYKKTLDHIFPGGCFFPTRILYLFPVGTVLCEMCTCIVFVLYPLTRKLHVLGQFHVHRGNSYQIEENGNS